MSNEYHFETHWRFNATAAEIYAILYDATELVRWWPSVYLAVEELQAGNENNVGRVIDLHTKGWLPYTLRWQFTVTEVVQNRRLALAANGDFVGSGVWSLTEENDWTHVHYDWRIEAQKPMLRTLAPLLRPLFQANHEWAMNKGFESLNLELQRRRSKTAADAAAVPAPPPPVPDWPYAVGGALVALFLLRRIGRK